MGIRVLLVDDQPIVRTGFRTVLSATGGFDVVGEAGDGPAGLVWPGVIAHAVNNALVFGLAAALL
ncbi:response regulator transcription factor [Actinomycetospora sp. CA-101289]|uniref:response regulator transcription factor n=1 Tax=Actinomycetospora sp. CA-101289 TaxID=3239893 RepID=UPI003D9774F2